LLEFRETLDTLKNTSKPFKNLVIKFLALSTSIVRISARIAPK